jgi:hypothetical protein
MLGHCNLVEDLPCYILNIIDTPFQVGPAQGPPNDAMHTTLIHRAYQLDDGIVTGWFGLLLGLFRDGKLGIYKRDTREPQKGLSTHIQIPDTSRSQT